MRLLGRPQDHRQGDGPAPADLFDRTFNNPALLNGEDPYTSVAPIPFDPARPLTWTIADGGGQNGTIRARLAAALSCNDDDLTRLAQFVRARAAGTLTLGLTDLSWLYRLARAASVFELSIDQYLVALGLLYYRTPAARRRRRAHCVPPCPGSNSKSA